MSRLDTDRGCKPELVFVGCSMPEGVLAYLATPYSKYENGNLELAFRDAANLAARLMLAGVRVYSPIAHTHPLAIHGNVDPLDHDIWLPFDEAMMQRCEVLIVAQMKGWRESKGVQHEIQYYLKRARTIFVLDPVSMNMRRMVGTAATLASEQQEPRPIPIEDHDIAHRWPRKGAQS